MGESQITALPLGEADRAQFIDAANKVFEKVLERMAPANPENVRKRWDAGHYIDNVLLHEDMLPISRDYALSLIDAFLVHHVADLAAAEAGPPGIVDALGMDEDDPDIKPGLTCHVEIDNEAGETSREIDMTTAWALRRLAAQIEARVLDSGFHPIKTPNGKEIGKVYLDYYEGTRG
jgi:hypothetical protein